MDAANRLCKRYRTRATLAGSCFAFGFSILSLTQCSFLSTETSTQQQQTLLGLFSRPFQNDHGESLGCVAYSSIESSTFGSFFKTSRAFAVLTALLSGLSAIFMATVLVWKPPKWSKRIWIIAKYAVTGATICSDGDIYCVGRCGPMRRHRRLLSDGRRDIGRLQHRTARGMQFFLSSSTSSKVLLAHLVAATRN